MIERLIIILISFSIGIIYLLIIRGFDKYEKEPLKQLLIAFFAGGLLAFILSFPITNYLHFNNDNLLDNFKEGLIEETTKLITLTCIYPIIKKNLNEITDGIMYLACVSLGFG